MVVKIKAQIPHQMPSPHLQTDFDLLHVEYLVFFVGLKVLSDVNFCCIVQEVHFHPLIRADHRLLIRRRCKPPLSVAKRPNTRKQVSIGRKCNIPHSEQRECLLNSDKVKVIPLQPWAEDT